MSSPPFSPALLLPILARLPQARGYRVAFSGGCDSTVLLHALASLREELGAPLGAIHVDHQLQPRSAEWAASCEATCARYGVPCVVARVDARPRAGESREAAARRARYAALAGALIPGERVVTAHHQDDQAETLLLQLMRGSGPRGLSAMPEVVPFAQGDLVRPLLGFSRAALCRFARNNALTWVDDPSNVDTVFDRNFLRREILPRLEGRWPALTEVLARSARLQAESSHLLDELAALDLREAALSPGSLSVARLLALEPPRRRNLLRYALRRRGLPVPGHVTLERILTEVLTARPDAEPRVAWPGAEVRRYRDALCFMAPLETPPPHWSSPWNGTTPLTIPCAGSLHATTAKGQGLAARGSMEVRLRTGGERCRPQDRGHTHLLKKLLQERGVPPWERERLPLVYIGGDLAAVADLWICENFVAKPDESGLLLHWDRFAIEK